MGDCYNIIEGKNKNTNIKALGRVSILRAGGYREREYCQKNKEMILREIRAHNKAHREQIRKYNREYGKKRRENPKYRLNDSISTAIWKSLKGNKNGYHWESLVNYTLKDLISHLEKKFKKDMNWNNFGKVWHIDHIIPKSWFNYTSIDEEEFKQCWRLENLQPKCAKENIVKRNKYADNGGQLEFLI